MPEATPEPPPPPLTLLLGGARSGKSRYALALAEAEPGACVYVATAEARDAEMAERIRRHRELRSERWTTLEEPLALAPLLAEQAGPGRTVVVDCLTLWLSNVMDAGGDVGAECDRLVETLPGLGGPAILVANEVGLGIVPENALARAFRDHAGRLNQRVAAAAGRVVLLAAGLPLVLKDGAGEAVAPSPPSNWA